MALTRGQRQFRDQLAQQTGLHRSVIGAWMLAEESGGAAQARERQGNQNWLNIGYFDSGPGSITKSKAFRDPSSAAAATAQFLKGQKFGASPGIRKILSARGASPQAQVQAIARSGWATNPQYGRNISRLLGQGGTGGGSGGSTGVVRAAPTTTRIPGQTITTQIPTVDQQGFQQAQRQSVLAGMISRRNPNSFLLRSGLLSTTEPSLSDFTGSKTVTDNIPGKTVTIPGKTVIKPGSAIASGATGDIAKVVERANILNAKHHPYLWGGGHGARVTNINKVGPVDCSGAVSAVLGINPRVSGQFTAWGRPGDGGSKGITIAANSHHVLMKINGHWFGTSHSNPGGGAGWIPQSAISPQYLKGFTLRHSNA